MKISFQSRTPVLALLRMLLAVGLLLSGCEIEGGVPAVPPTSQPLSLPQPTEASVATAIAERNDTWIVGLLEVPRNLYPYQPSPSAQRVAAPITELLFPSPILAFNYGYTTTGVLEQVPTLENGGATLQKADVYLDAAGNITSTVTEVITQVDQLVVTYRWNPELHWSDGTPLTAADSVFAYEIAKVAPPNDEARDRLAQTVSYEQVDEHTTRAVLRPDVTGPTYFLNYWTPLPRHLLQNADPATLADSDFAQAPVGYGPYALEARTADEITLARNRYAASTPSEASRVTFVFPSSLALARAGILNGNLDVIFTDRVFSDTFATFEAESTADEVRLLYTPNPIWEQIAFNLDAPALKDGRVRRAIALGTNREGIVDQLMRDHTPVLESWVLPQQPEAAPPDQLAHYVFDPDQARALLDEAGFTDPDGDGVRASAEGVSLTLKLITTSSPPLRPELAAQFKADMQQIGVQVNVEELPSDQAFARNGPLFQRQFELALFGWAAAPYAGGLSLWGCGSVPTEANGWAGENISGWCVRDADRALRTAISTLDANERHAAYVQQQQLWTQDLPALPLFQRLSLTAVAPGVQGLQPDAFAPITWNIDAWQRTNAN